MSVWGALGFMGLGGAIVLAFCILAWRMYRIGRGERPRSTVNGKLGAVHGMDEPR